MGKSAEVELARLRHQVAELTLVAKLADERLREELDRRKSDEKLLHEVEWFLMLMHPKDRHPNTLRVINALRERLGLPALDA